MNDIAKVLLIRYLKNLIRFPVRLFFRIFVCPFMKHQWVWLGNGFFGFFAPSKPFRCSRCGRGHTGEMSKPMPKRF